MKKILSLILLLFISTTIFGQINVEEETFILKPSIAMNTVDINVIELNVIDINDIKTNNLIFDYYNLGPINVEDVLNAIYFSTFESDLDAIYFTTLGKSLNVLLCKSPLSLINMSVDINIINVSEQWTVLYNTSIKPMTEYYEAKIDLLGKDGIYYPSSMTYYGYWWIELQKRQDKEGMTDEIHKEWIKLFKEMKPYYNK